MRDSEIDDTAHEALPDFATVTGETMGPILAALLILVMAALVAFSVIGTQSHWSQREAPGRSSG